MTLAVIQKLLVIIARETETEPGLSQLLTDTRGSDEGEALSAPSNDDLPIRFLKTALLSTRVMTTRKSALVLPARTPAFVSREVGAAELGISPETWDRWVSEGILPLAAPGFPASTPRWRWMDVDHKLAGKSTELASLESYLTGIGKIRGSKKGSGREAA